MKYLVLCCAPFMVHFIGNKHIPSPRWDLHQSVINCSSTAVPHWGVSPYVIMGVLAQNHCTINSLDTIKYTV